MVQELNSAQDKPNAGSQPPLLPIYDGADARDGLEEIIEQMAAGLYSLASMLVGEGEASVRLVEAAIASAKISPCADPREARAGSRWSLARSAVELLAARSPDSLAAPEGLEPASTCIEEDDLNAAGLDQEELQRMISGPERDRVRKWLAGLPEVTRTVFVLRAVAGLNAAETAALLKEQGGEQAAGWTRAAVGEVFRQGLCSLASQLLHASAGR
jgi:hypothetical protein